MTVKAQSPRSLTTEGLTQREWDVYNLIYTLRKERGKLGRITQQEVANQVGMDKAMLSRYLRSLRIIGVLGRDSAGATTVIRKRLRRKSS